MRRAKYFSINSSKNPLCVAIIKVKEGKLEEFACNFDSSIIEKSEAIYHKNNLLVGNSYISKRIKYRFAQNFIKKFEKK